MAASKLSKERENFCRTSILIVDQTRDSFVDLLELHLSKNHITFEDFVNRHIHKIFHLCYNKTRCCQCTGNLLQSRSILSLSQLELILDKNVKLPGHRYNSNNDFCCCQAKLNISTSVLDITFARCLLINFVEDIFWDNCLEQGSSLEDFLNKNQHHLYHLLEVNVACCRCPRGYSFPVDRSILHFNQWNILFSRSTLSCLSHQNNPNIKECCIWKAKSGILIYNLDNTLRRIILQQCCPLRKTVENLIQIRNKIYGHINGGKISDEDYSTYLNDIQPGIVEIAKICGKEDTVKGELTNLQKRTLDETLCLQYHDTLLRLYLQTKDFEELKEDLKNILTQQSRTLPDFLLKDIENETVVEGCDVSFEIWTKEENTTVQWLKDDKVIKIDGRISCTRTRYIHSLRICASSLSDRGVYKVKIENSVRSALLKVNEYFTKGLTPVACIEGENAVFKAEVIDDGVNSVWKKDGLQIVLNNSEKYAYQKSGKCHQLTIFNTCLEDSGDYTVDVNDRTRSTKLLVKGMNQAVEKRQK